MKKTLNHAVPLVARQAVPTKLQLMLYLQEEHMAVLESLTYPMMQWHVQGNVHRHPRRRIKRREIQINASCPDDILENCVELFLYQCIVSREIFVSRLCDVRNRFVQVSNRRTTRNMDEHK